MNENNFNNNAPNMDSPQFVPAKCPNCGGELAVDQTQQCTVCQYCGTPFIVANAVRNYSVHNTTIVNERKGTVESILSYASKRQDKKQQRLEEERRREEEARRIEEEKARKRKNTILWVLGWIFIFPVPLMILLHRNKAMRFKFKAGITAIAWIFYIIIFFPKTNRASYDTPVNVPEEHTRVVSTEPERTAESFTEAITEIITEAASEEATDEEAVTEPEETPAEQPPEEVQADTPSVSDIKNAVNNGDYSLVTPEFKETMDAYEAFYDEYIAFMKNYSSGEGDIMAMMNDYMDMLNKLDEWSSRIDAIDESALSPADDAYYLLVTMRISGKMLTAY